MLNQFAPINRHGAILLTAVLLFLAGRVHAAEASASKPGETFKTVEIPFYDDAPKDAKLFTFRNDLLKAVLARDVKAVLDVLDPTVLSGFDGEEGIDAFKTRWKLNGNPEASALWKELGEALRLGGKINKGQNETYFIAPYSYYALPEEYDPIDYGLIVGEGVNVRSKPEENAEVVEKVGRIIVRLYEEPNPKVAKIGDETFPWRKVGLPDGKTGYVWGKFVRSPNDFRVGFSNRSGQWKMIYFVAGD
jgi:hypothetical protein